MWLLQATSDPYYQNYVVQNVVALGGLAGTGSIEFSWDSKYSGVHVLASKILMDGTTGVNTDAFKAYQTQAESAMCAGNERKSNEANQWRLIPRGETDEYDLKLDIHQELVSKWRRGKAIFFKVQCTVTNRNEHTVKKLILTSDELQGPVIGLHRLRGRKNSFTLPKKLKALQPGESFTFTYVSVKARKADISVKQVLLE
ncbi:hypothetical protein R1sor_017412 [Riccia sorocarpa]|uniref:cellulase n=1 Tax=Riccia sorocarpa TaxID=122646 RepID=A0ABD3I6S5_9MARC